jgi:hypothetical protein
VKTSNLALINDVPTYFTHTLPVKWIPQESQFFQRLADQIICRVMDVAFHGEYLLPAALDRAGSVG